MVSVSGEGDGGKPFPVYGHSCRFLPSRQGLLELAVFFGAFWIIDAHYFSSESLLQFHPHPFWIPVVLLTLQYGVVDGLVAATASIAAVYLTGWPQQALGEDYFAFWLRAWLEPSLWVGTALMIGQLRQFEINGKDRLQLTLAHEQHKSLVLSETCEELRAKIERLERRIVGREAISPDAYLAIVDFYGSTADVLPQALTRKAKIVLGDVDFSLFLVREGTSLSLVNGAVEIDFASSPTQEIQAVLDDLAIKRRVLSIRNPDAGCLLGINAIFAGAIVRPDSDEVIGVLAVDRLNGELSAGDIETNIALLCRAVSDVLEKHWAEIAAHAANVKPAMPGSDQATPSIENSKDHGSGKSGRRQHRKRRGTLRHAATAIGKSRLAHTSARES